MGVSARLCGFCKIEQICPLLGKCEVSQKDLRKKDSLSGLRFKGGGGAACVAITALKASLKRFGDSPLKRVSFKFYSLK